MSGPPCSTSDAAQKCVIVIAATVGSVGDPDEYKLRHNEKIYNQSRKRSDRGTPSGQTPESASPT